MERIRPSRVQFAEPSSGCCLAAVCVWSRDVRHVQFIGLCLHVLPVRHAARGCRSRAANTKLLGVPSDLLACAGPDGVVYRRLMLAAIDLVDQMSGPSVRQEAAQ
jgi:hypothetical protein